ncbi:MAG: hypothetical protein HY700_02720 [Gemmatimonadetes bacterium]|nr:hypothetical protein [Gemmatimonadota bacterium]
MNTQYVWLIWSSAFLCPWLVLFLLLPAHRKAMWRTSLVTALFGLTEPIFVPAYWNPPSLFNLAQTTGFDIESLIFCFGIGGVGAVLYNGLTGQALIAVGDHERRHSHHRWHRLAVIAPVLVSPPLYLLPWNPIYPGIVAMTFGAGAAIACRRDLTIKTLIGGAVFLGYYALFMAALILSVPGYIEQVWNLPALSGVLVFGIPLEELLFGAAFGMYWSAVYEHLTWTRTVRLAAPVGVPAGETG